MSRNTAEVKSNTDRIYAEYPFLNARAERKSISEAEVRRFDLRMLCTSNCYRPTATSELEGRTVLLLDEQGEVVYQLGAFKTTGFWARLLEAFTTSHWEYAGEVFKEIDLERVHYVLVFERSILHYRLKLYKLPVEFSTAAQWFAWFRSTRDYGKMKQFLDSRVRAMDIRSFEEERIAA